MAKKKHALKWLTGAFDLFGELFDMVKKESEDKLEEIKQKVKFYMVVYGLFIIALLFILLGFTKYLAEKGVFASEGMSFMIIGSILVVILAAYSMIKQA